ncbi:MAG: DUF2339 domain-containing protein [Candidatus Hydrogenedentes bacterium]|nr:DUF2339 domain-containing protein [Candidatus Hydrogenedentota bacterium]
MPDNNEIRVLRSEVNRLRTALEQVEQRLGRLEMGAATETAPIAAKVAEAPVAPLAPPPLPSRVELARPEAEPVETPRPPVASPIAEVPAPLPLREPLPSLADRATSLLRRLGPKEEMSWEMALGTYWMPRVAVIIIALGLVSLATYVSSTYANAPWMPYARLAGGFALSLGMLGAGRWLEPRYRGYARVLMGGGMGMLYFMTFCMHYVPYTRVIQSPEPVLLLLGAQVLWWAAIAHRRRSPMLACVMILGGQLTIGLSTFTLDHPSRFAAAGIVALALLGAGSLLLHRWYAVAALAMVSSYANHFIWLAHSDGGDTVLDFSVAMAILAGYWIIFAGAELLAPEGLRRRAIHIRWRNSYVGFNTAAYTLMGGILVEAFDFTSPYSHAFWWISGAMLLGTGALYRWRRSDDPLQHIYLLKASALITIGFAIYFNGASLGLSMAVEALILLLGARKLGLKVSRLASLGLVGLTGIQMLFTWLGGYAVPYNTPGYWPLFIPSLLVALALFAYSEVYRTGDFVPKISSTRRRRPQFAGIQMQLELLPQAPGAPMMPLTRFLGEYGAVTLGFVLYACFASLLFHENHLMLAYAIPVPALGALAAARGSKPFALTALWGAVLPLAAGWVGMDGASPMWAIMATGLMLTIHGVWAEHRYWGLRPGLAMLQLGAGPYLAYVAPVLFAISYILTRQDGITATGMMLGFAVLLFALTALLHPNALAGWGIAAYVLAGCLWFDVRADAHPFGWYAAALWIAVLGACGDRYLAASKIFPRGIGSAILLSVALLAGMRLGLNWFTSGWYLASWAVLALLFGAYAGIFRQIAAGVLSLGLAVLGSCLFAMQAYDTREAVFQAALLGGGYLIYWVALERAITLGADRISEARRALLNRVQLSGVLAGAVTVLLVLITSSTPALRAFYLTIAWTLCATALIGFSLVTRQAWYRYAGLALFGLTILRLVFVDMGQLPGIYRVAAAIVLGCTLLALAYGYVWARAHGRDQVSAETPAASKDHSGGPHQEG